ncbi:MAG: hypothetical protein ACP5R6_03025 [Chlorobaculum sp.]
MALIKAGSIDHFTVRASASKVKAFPFLENISTFAEMGEVTRKILPDSFEYAQSAEARGLSLKSLKLTEGFNGFLGNVFSSKNNVYFIAWAWDLSGQPISQYPGDNFDVKSVIIPLKVGKLREFIGEGINLFPKRKITGGIAIRIQLWESDEDTRKLGKVMADTSDAIKKSTLSSLISAIALTGLSGATITLIKDASLELAKVIGTVLESNGDDYVDFFEGYYPSDGKWETGSETYKGNSSVITLGKY